MPEIYADWKSLTPLDFPVHEKTKCVVINRGKDNLFCLGEIVTVEELDVVPYCKNSYGVSDVVHMHDLALLPSDYQAEPKAKRPAPAKPERKVVQIATNGGVIVVLCDDGTMLAFNGDHWRKLPPIPQD